MENQEVVEKNAQEIPDAEKGKKVLTKNGWVYLPYGITSFGELQTMERGQEVSNEIIDLASCMPALVENIMVDDELTDKAAAIRVIGNELADIVGDLMADVKSRKSIVDVAKEMFRKVVPNKTVIKSTSEEGLFIFKNADGKMAWLGRYSNNIIDDDLPPDVIASKSHEDFLKSVEAGETPYPELWLWHEPSARVGKATWLEYDKETGFAMAAGVFDDGMEEVAMKLAKAEGLGMSHGMYVLETDPRNKHIITKHRTREISVLPLDAAANKRTSFVVLEDNKEMNKMIDPNKASLLKTQLGLSDADVDNLNRANKAQSDAANAEGLLRKETTPVAEETPEPVVEEPAAAEDTEPVVETEPATEEATASAFTDEQVKELGEVFAIHTKNIEAMLKPIVDELRTVQKSAQQPPTLAGMLFGVDKSQSVLASESTKVEGNLLASKPAETKEEKRPEFVQNPGLNNLLVNIIPGSEEA